MSRYESLTLGEVFVEKLQSMTSGASVGNKSMKFYFNKETLADDGEFDLPSAIQGFALITDETNFLVVHIKTDGTVLALVDSGDGADTSDTDGDLCAYDNGTKVSIKNRTGSEADVTAFLVYAGE